MKRVLALCLVFVVLLCGCGVFPKEQSMRKTPVNKTALETQYFTVATVQRGDVSSGYTAVCTYGTQQSENLAFNVPYENLTGIYVKVGDPVYEGQLLAEISLGTLEEEITQCEDTCSQIDSDLEYYSMMVGFEEERQKLAKNYGRTFDTANLETLTLKRNELAGQKMVADKKLSETREKLSGRKLVASFNGVVTYVRELRPWEPVQMTTFITVTSTDSGFLSTVEDPSLFREGDVYRIETDDDIIPCTLTSIRETQMKGRYLLVLTPTEKDMEIEAGTQGSIRIVFEEAKNVLYIPTEALRTIDEKNAVYVVDSNGLRDIRYIEIGLSVSGMTPADLNRTEVRSGLLEGDTIIIR